MIELGACITHHATPPWQTRGHTPTQNSSAPPVCTDTWPTSILGWRTTLCTLWLPGTRPGLESLIGRSKASLRGRPIVRWPIRTGGFLLLPLLGINETAQQCWAPAPILGSGKMTTARRARYRSVKKVKENVDNVLAFFLPTTAVQFIKRTLLHVLQLLTS